jgi:hypothetical protein
MLVLARPSVGWSWSVSVSSVVGSVEGRQKCLGPAGVALRADLAGKPMPVVASMGDSR